jgi:hypothetical protein
VSNGLRVGVVLCLVALGLSITPCRAFASEESGNRIVSAGYEKPPSSSGASEAPAGSGCADGYPCPCLCSIACPGGQPAGGPAFALAQPVRTHLLNPAPDSHCTLLSYRIFHPPRSASCR